MATADKEDSTKHWVLLSRLLGGLPDEGRRKAEERWLTERIGDGRLRARYFNVGDKIADPRTGRRYDPPPYRYDRLPEVFWRNGNVTWKFSMLTLGDERAIYGIEIFVPGVEPLAADQAAAADAVTYSTGAPGRRTSSHIVRPEAVRRLVNGRAKVELASGRPCKYRLDLATDLSTWLTEAHPRAAPMKPKTISTAIADLWLEAIK
jgi:hypothetical protein